MLSEIVFHVNGKKIVYTGNPLTRLVDVLREDLGLTGVKEGCGEGECGACSVIKDGKLVTSCIIPVGAVNGSEIYTIEGIRDTEKVISGSHPCLITSFLQVWNSQSRNGSL